jgi:hypothetical protein
MRILNLVLCAFMVLFAAAQYNDPDPLFWAVAYLIPAFWAGLAGLRPALLKPPAAKAGLAASLALYVVGTVYFWPSDANWWLIDVWWESEEAREGMGMMLSTLVIAVAGLTMLLRRGRPAAAGGRA